MPKTNYVVIYEVTKKLADGETLCLQQVYPVIDGVKYFDDVGFRFIRKTKDGLLKAHRGQAQANLKDFEELLKKIKR